MNLISRSEHFDDLFIVIFYIENLLFTVGIDIDNQHHVFFFPPSLKPKFKPEKTSEQLYPFNRMD